MIRRKKTIIWALLAVLLTLVCLEPLHHTALATTPAPDVSATPDSNDDGDSGSPADDEDDGLGVILPPDPSATEEPEEPIDGDIPPIDLPVPQLPPEDNLPDEMIKSGSFGDNVVLLQMRLRDLGYYDYKITGYFGAYTEAAVKAFQSQNSLTSDGSVGPQTTDVLYNNKAIRRPVKPVVKPTPPGSTPSSGSKVSKVPKGVMWDWFTKVRGLIRRGSKFQVIDVSTKVRYTMVMVGGSNHCDVEPATKADCDKLKSTYGGSWNWDRRAVVVNINGTWVAGSINGMPHGYETIANNGMTGQVCIHFLNSKTHIKGMKDSEHQAMVRKAAG